MKFVLAFAVLIVAAAAAPAAPIADGSAVILKDLRSNDGVHGYQFDFETSNGISRQETGVLREVDKNQVIVVDGVASWTSPEGMKITLKYAADENGYQPVLPVV